MASVRLSFIPPFEDDIAALRIYESPDKSGSPTPFSQIERVTAIGTYPNYIDDYTTTLANNPTDWFGIAWEDTAGAVSDMSVPVQGGTETLTGILVERIMLRDPSINEIVAAQTAEAAISEYFGVDDPNSVDPATVSPKILEGLTLLSLAWSFTVSASTSSSAQKFTAGLVSMDSGSSSATKTTTNVEDLMKLANRLLGSNFSAILQLEDIPVSLGYRQLIAVDLSRTMIEI